MTHLHALPNLGTQQSPVQLEHWFNTDDLRVTVDWTRLVATPYEDKKKEGKLSVTSSNGNLVVDGKEYVPIEIHAHAPAEHILGGGKPQPAEVHVVHAHKDDFAMAKLERLEWCRLAVLGIFLTQKDGAPPYTLHTYKHDPEKKVKVEVEVLRKDLLPEETTAVRYSGSLTTPPYAENVEFVLFTTPRAFSVLPAGPVPRRPLQALNRRHSVRGKVKFGNPQAQP